MVADTGLVIGVHAARHSFVGHPHWIPTESGFWGCKTLWCAGESTLDNGYGSQFFLIFLQPPLVCGHPWQHLYGTWLLLLVYTFTVNLCASGFDFRCSEGHEMPFLGTQLICRCRNALQGKFFPSKLVESGSKHPENSQKSSLLKFFFLPEMAKNTRDDRPINIPKTRNPRRHKL